MDIRSRVTALNAERLNVVEQLRAELDATAGRERSEEEQTKIARMDARIGEIDDEIREFVTRETREREAAQLREAADRIFGNPQPEQRPLSPDAALRAWCQDREAQPLQIGLAVAMRERELLRAGASPEELRALAWDTGSSGSLVPTNLARSLYEYLEASIAMFRAPTTKINTADGAPLQFPKVAAHTIGTTLVAQGTAYGGTDPTFDKITLNAYDYVSLVHVHNHVLRDAGVDLASFLGRDMGRGVGRLADTALTIGGGSSAPNGIITAGSVSKVTGGTITPPTVEHFIDLQHTLVDEYRSSPSCAWLMNDSTVGTVRKYRDGAGGTVGAFLWQPSLTNGIQGGTPDMFLGKPVYSDPNVPALGSGAKFAAFADLSAYYVRIAGGGVELARSTDLKFAENQTSFRATLSVDGDTPDAGAIRILQMA